MVTKAPRVSTFAALGVREFRLFFIGMVLSNIGTWMQVYGLGYLMVQLAIRDGEPQLAAFYIGLLGLARSIPSIGFGLFGGVIADRFERRQLLILTQVAGGLSALALGVVILIGQATVVSVVVLAGLLAASAAVEAPTRQAMMPNLVERHLLPSALGLGGMSNNGSILIGPLIGGVLILQIGVEGLVFVNAASFLVLIAMLAMMKKQAVDSGARNTSMLHSLAEGFRYARSDEMVRTLIIVWVAMALLGRPYFQLLPAFANGELGVGPVELSWLLAATGLGGVAAGFLTGRLGAIERRGVLILTIMATFGLSLLLLSAQRSVIPALVLGATTGATTFTLALLINTTTQTITPDRLRGRVASMMTLAIQGGLPLGTLMLGTIGSLTSTSTAITIGSIGMLAVCAIVAVRIPIFRNAHAGHISDRADEARAALS